MRRSLPKALGVGAVIVALALTATACGDDDSDADAEPVFSPTELQVQDQNSDGATVTVASVTMPSPGFMTVHSDDDGAPGPVIGHSDALLPTGESSDVTVELYEPLSESATVWAMPHIDADSNGSYEFAAPDNLIDGPALTADEQVSVLPLELTVTG